MQLTAAHLRYLLAIYEVSRTHLDISSRSIAEKLGVTKPSVVRILNLLMEQGMIVKEYYGKIYLTDRGIWVAKRVQQCRTACRLPGMVRCGYFLIARRMRLAMYLCPLTVGWASVAVMAKGMGT